MHLHNSDLQTECKNIQFYCTIDLFGLVLALNVTSAPLCATLHTNVRIFLICTVQSAVLLSKSMMNTFDPNAYTPAKLEAAGIGGRLLEWLRDWLAQRKQRVVVEGEESGWTEVISSVLQGSVLGGLLFIIFIDDIDKE